MIMFALGGKAAEAINNDTADSAIYRFLKHKEKVDYKMCEYYVTQLTSDPLGKRMEL
jgi:hypothetical protein